MGESEALLLTFGSHWARYERAVVGCGRGEFVTTLMRAAVWFMSSCSEHSFEHAVEIALGVHHMAPDGFARRFLVVISSVMKA